MSTWLRLCPFDLAADAPLAEVARVLADPEVAAELGRGAVARAYPDGVLARLRAAGVLRLLSEAPGEPSSCLTFPHLTALNAMTAAVDGALAITLGVNALALLPSYAFATPAQLERTFARVREGAFASLLLTELQAGSDLLACQTRALRVEGGYRLSGEKDIINGGTRHALLTVLARTRDDRGGRDFMDRAGDFSVFVVDREATADVHATPRWHTLPAPAADIAGVYFDSAWVADDTRLSDEGEGFTVVQRTLTLSRGGVSGLAAGVATHAATLARVHARERKLYGAPIGKLGAIAEHTLRAAAFDLLTAALSVRTALLVDQLGPGAAYYTAAAKYACCAYAEQAVDEGRHVLGGRALVEAMPYAQLVRDVLLYGTFDGTRHVMLAEVARRMTAAVEKDDPLDLGPPASAPSRLVEVARRSARVQVLPLRRIAPPALQPLVRTLAAVSAKLRRSSDQALLFAAADVLARLEAVVALHTLAARAEPIVARYAGASQGARLAQAADALALRTGATPDPDLRGALAGFLADEEAARIAWQDLAPDLR